MPRQRIATFMCFVIALAWLAIMWRSMLAGLVRHQVRLGPWMISALLGLLCYGIATHRRWARWLGLIVTTGSLLIWPMVMMWAYVFSGFSNRSGSPAVSPWMILIVAPPMLFSLALFVMFVRPFAAFPPTERSRR